MANEMGAGPWGRLVVSRLYGFRKIAIYANGYIQINGKTAEKLLAIRGNTDSVVSKSGLGRAVGALFTLGLNLWTPNLRGRMILSIFTDQDTYIYNDPAEPHFLAVMQELVTVGTSVINTSSSRPHPHIDALNDEHHNTTWNTGTTASDNAEGGLLGRLRAFGEETTSKTSELKALKESLKNREISPAEFFERKDKLFGRVQTPQPEFDENDIDDFDAPDDQLSELTKLFNSGVLTAAEFADLKARASQRKKL
jgi:hypothetical protein